MPPLPGSGRWLARAVLPGWRAVIADPPGFGASDKPAEGLDFGTLAEGLAGWLAQEAIAPDAVVAWGAGVPVALAALGAVERVPARLVLVAQPDFRGPEALVTAWLARARWRPRGQLRTLERLARQEGRAEVERAAARALANVGELRHLHRLRARAVAGPLGPPP